MGGGWGVPSGGEQTFIWRGQEDGIAMIYCAQSKVKCGPMGKAHGVNGGGGGHGPHDPNSY